MQYTEVVNLTMYTTIQKFGVGKNVGFWKKFLMLTKAAFT